MRGSRHRQNHAWTWDHQVSRTTAFRASEAHPVLHRVFELLVVNPKARGVNHITTLTALGSSIGCQRQIYHPKKRSTTTRDVPLERVQPIGCRNSILACTCPTCRHPPGRKWTLDCSLRASANHQQRIHHQLQKATAFSPGLNDLPQETGNRANQITEFTKRARNPSSIT
jgi:hypothetical protein